MSASVVMRTKATAEATEAILTKLLLETRYPSGRASISCFMQVHSYKLAMASAHTYNALRILRRVLAGCVIHGFRHSNFFSLPTVAPFLSALVKALERLHVVLSANSSTCGLKYR